MAVLTIYSLSAARRFFLHFTVVESDQATSFPISSSQVDFFIIGKLVLSKLSGKSPADFTDLFAVLIPERFEKKFLMTGMKMQNRNYDERPCLVNNSVD